MTSPDAALADKLEDLARAASEIAQILRSGVASTANESVHWADQKVTPDVDPSALLNARQVAELVGVNVRTLRRLRHEGRAPKPLKGKGPLRWTRGAIDRWIEERAS